ncbi:MAG: dephospho-CoA kinase [Caldilineae bacterium]|nr:MAG: dephospho-CoA kinase [Caldilineae bacterium]
MSHRPLIIGLTGNIGVGKSTVLDLLRKKGARAIDADKLAHRVMAPGGPAYDAIVATFGSEILAEDGSIDRSRLGAQVFSDPTKLARLESIVHPAVFQALRAEIQQATEPVVVIEAIKLLEAGLAITLCDQVWVVTAPVEQQIERLMRTRHMSRQAAEARMAAQSPQEEKVRQADVVIDNSGDRKALAAQVDAAWRALLGKRISSRKSSAGEETNSPNDSTP